VRPAAEAEKLGIVGVVVTTPGFTEVAHLAAKAAGMPGLSIAEYPGVIGVHQDEIRAKIKETLFDRILDGILRGAGAADEAGSAADAAALHGTPEEIAAQFQAKGWTDGLPIVVPTPERVAAFLRFIDRQPDEEVAILPQARRRATPRNIAANAIMAGCLPQHMPILVAAVEAAADEHFNLNNIGTTWGLVPYLIVHGPLVRQLGLACEGQLISQGPNPAIGRAFGLILRNIAGYVPGRNQLGTFGYPLPFALAENTEENPWEPLHVERGMPPGTSAVSVGTTLNWGYPPSPYARPDKTAAQATLEALCMDVVRKPSIARLAEQGPGAFIHDVTFLLAPPLAKALAEAGYGKADIQRYVYENARIPMRDLKWELDYGLADVKTIEEKVSEGLYPPEYLDAGPDDRVRVLHQPDMVHLVVCGDPGRNRLKTLDTGYTRLTTHAVKLPAAWNELLTEARQL